MYPEDELPSYMLQRYLNDARITQGEFADTIKVSRFSINQIINGHRKVTADMALRLEKPTGIPAMEWLLKQLVYDLEQARKKRRK